MKKSILTLKMVWILILCLLCCACSTTEKDSHFTAEEYVAAFAELNEGVTIVESAPGLLAVEYEQGSPVNVNYNAQGLCTAISTQVTTALDDSEAASTAGVKLGMSTTKMIYVARYLELDKNEEAVGLEMDDVLLGFHQLMSSMTENDYLAMMEAPVTKETTISGHPATLTMAFDVLEMALVMTVTYLP